MTDSKISAARRVEIEAEAAKSLLLNLRDILADDQEAAADAIEGETNLLEALDRACARYGEVKGLCAGLDAHMETLKKRQERLGNQMELLRAALNAAAGAYREATGKAKIELPSGTLSLKRVPPSLRIVNDADIPAEFYKPQDPKLDRKAITDALKAGKAVAGCEMSNGSETLQISLG